MRKVLLGSLAAAALLTAPAAEPATAGGPDYWVVHCISKDPHDKLKSTIVYEPQQMKNAVAYCIDQGGHPRIHPVFR